MATGSAGAYEAVAKSWMGAEQGMICSFPSALVRSSSQHPPLRPVIGDGLGV